VAALLKNSLGLEVELVKSGGGEFTVWFNDQKVASKGFQGFPSDEECLQAVRTALHTSGKK
jgi:hypothetical protein